MLSGVTNIDSCLLINQVSLINQGRKKLKEKGHLVPCPKGRTDTGNGNELSLDALIKPYGLSLLMDFFGAHPSWSWTVCPLFH